MEEDPKSIQSINDNNNINEEEIPINFFSNFIKENENDNKNDNNDYDEDNKEENSIYKSILDDLNNNIEINIKNYENKNYKECKEILDILGGVSPFKPLLKPKKISMIGKVLIGIPDEEHNNSKENATLNDNNNGKN